MKTSFLASVALATVLGAGGAMALMHAAPAQAQTQESTRASAGETVTVFVDATLGFRKKHMAKKLTESHAEYAARGYRFASLVAYNENGDLVGFFVTYTKP